MARQLTLSFRAPLRAGALIRVAPPTAPKQWRIGEYVYRKDYDYRTGKAKWVAHRVLRVTAKRVFIERGNDLYTFLRDAVRKAEGRSIATAMSLDREELEMRGHTSRGGVWAHHCETFRTRPAVDDITRKAIALLGLPDSYTVDDVKRAYRIAARRTHPDLGGSAAAFQTLRVAYEQAKACANG